jgi:hypothetical protein
VANLESDIIGRVNRLALRPSEKNALMPLMEAVSNSVHSITDLYGTDSAKGQIIVRVIREDQPNGRVTGFDVEDNGIGFTGNNFKSFRTPDSRWKETRGGKGVGRLGWLKVFDRITIDSTFEGNDGWQRRSFDFRLTESDQIHEHQIEGLKAPRHLTVINFRGFKTPFDNRCPVRKGIIENRIAAHFVPLFVAGNAPKVTVEDEERTEIENLFADSIIRKQLTPLLLGKATTLSP